MFSPCFVIFNSPCFAGGDIRTGRDGRFVKGLQHRRVDGVVTVNKSDIGATGSEKACIAGRSKSTVLLVHGSDPIVLKGKAVGDGGTSIGTTIIDEPDIKVLEGLGEEAIHASEENLSAVVYGDDDADLCHFAP